MTTRDFQLEPITPESINREELEALVAQTMPYGRFKGMRLIDLPEPYVVWFKQRGYPEGILGQRLAAIYEIKLYGLEALLRPLVAIDGSAQSESSDPQLTGSE